MVNPASPQLTRASAAARLAAFANALGWGAHARFDLGFALLVQCGLIGCASLVSPSSVTIRSPRLHARVARPPFSRDFLRPVSTGHIMRSNAVRPVKAGHRVEIARYACASTQKGERKRGPSCGKTF